MKVARFHKLGGPEVLVYEDIPDPTPKEGEVLIKIDACGMNFADVMRRRGDPYPQPSPTPFILGVEVAGTVAALGKGVTSIEVGTPVLATPGDGGYAQYICVPAAAVIPLPAGVDPVVAAALVAHGLTAALALREAAKLKEGESVLIEAAAGGVGSFLVQLAKLYGAGKVIAAASSPEKRAAAERLGADASVDYTQPGWAEKVRELTGGRGVDVVIEMAGGDIAAQALTTMATFGRMIVVGQASGRSSLVDPWALTNGSHSVIGFYINNYVDVPGLIQSTMNEVMGHVMAGKIAPQIGAVLPLSKVVEAHRLIEGRQTTGKIVLQPWADA
ncbi:MAG TPA: NADPH:quinone oxidoreductase family protein [Parvibaculum sp.]